ncbi:MAG: DUF4193 family protein [Acidimicrobiales bacterium]
MASDGDTDEVFDEEELADGFDEEIIGEEDDIDEVDVEVDTDVDEDEDAVVDADVDEDVPVDVVVVEDDDVLDDADVELALDEVLAETIRRTSTPEDDDEAPGEVDVLADPMETILPKQDDEFRCNSCRLLKKMSQLADKSHGLCRDCV